MMQTLALLIVLRLREQITQLDSHFDEALEKHNYTALNRVIDAQKKLMKTEHPLSKKIHPAAFMAVRTQP